MRPQALSGLNSGVRHFVKLASVLTLTILLAPGLAAAQLGFGGGGGSGQSTSQGGGGGPDIGSLASELRDSDPAIRLEAVKALAAAAKDEEAVQHLIDATADADNRVRLKAIDSLGNARASAAIPVLVQSLYLRDSAPWLKQRVLVALGKIGDPRAAKPIADFLERDDQTDLMGTAIFSLGEIGNEKFVPALEKVAENTDNKRLSLLANDAIGKIRSRQINPEIEIQALRPQPGEIQRPASAGVGAPMAGY